MSRPGVSRISDLEADETHLENGATARAGMRRGDARGEADMTQRPVNDNDPFCAKPGSCPCAILCPLDIQEAPKRGKFVAEIPELAALWVARWRPPPPKPTLRLV
jgi:hypothetical protein